MIVSTPPPPRPSIKHPDHPEVEEAVFWDVAPCRSCVNWRFGGTYRLHLHGRKLRDRETSVSKWLQTIFWDVRPCRSSVNWRYSDRRKLTMSTGPYPEPEQSNPYHPILLLYNPFYHYPPTYVLIFIVVSFLLAFQPKSYMHSSYPHSCYMPCQYHLLLDHFNYTWRRVHVMKLLIMQFSPTSSHFISLQSKYSPQHPVLKRPQSMFLP
jgi:hypothetical protein